MSLQTRPPIITIMGHVDHGKTTLLDYIRTTNVAAREAGGITQHIGAYQIEFKGKPLTFIDTPGHAAFNRMRERGAQVTDFVILVVAANDGVKPQTIESIRHIKQSNVPFIVAINKTDLKDVYPDTVKAQLVEHGVTVTGFGGDVEAIDISAKTGKGVDALLDTLLVMAELRDLKSDPTAPLKAVVIESTKDIHKGSLARVIVQQGTLSLRQDLYTDTVVGKVRSLTNERGEQLQHVLPGYPAEIIGLTDVPEVGSILQDTSAAAEPDSAETDTAVLSHPADDWVKNFTAIDQMSMENILDQREKLKLILKADVNGTLEAILQNIDQESVTLLAYGIGPITENEVELARTAGALIIGFDVKTPKSVKFLAKNAGVKIKEYNIIYHLIEDLQKQMLRIMEPTIDEVITGEAEIIQVFEMRGETIAGIRVKTGDLKKTDLYHLKRNDEIIANPVIKSMKHGKEDFEEVKTKNEAGLTFKNKRLDFVVGDLLVAYHKAEE